MKTGSCSAKMEDLCSTLESVVNETIMEGKTPANQRDSGPIRRPSPLIYFYTNPSMFETGPGEESMSCKEFSFVVEWQMDNPSSDDSDNSTIT